MFALFISYTLLLFHLHNSMCQDNPNNITLNIITMLNDTNSLTCQCSETYTLLDQKPADVILNYNKVINEARCYYSNNNRDIYTGQMNKIQTLTRLEVTKIQAGKWTCEFLTLRDIGTIQPVVIRDNIKYTEVICEFNVHVRLSNGPTISINRLRVETKRQEVLTSEYDYIGYYYFQPGDPVNIECLRPKDVGSLNLALISAYDGHIFVNLTHKYMNRQIIMKLSEEHNNTYLDCTYSTMYNDLYIRIYLYINNIVIPAEDSLIIKINAEPLRSNPIILDATDNTAVNYLLYDLTYSNDEELKITCEKYQNSARELKLHLENVYGYRDTNPTTDGIVYKDIKTINLNNDSEVKCSLKTNRGTSMDYVIHFLNRSTNNGLLLSGLINKNILLDYEISNGFVHKIYYLYKNIDTLNLSCQCKTVNCAVSWIVNDNNSSRINSNEANFTLNQSHNNSVIKCENNYNKNAKIEIYLVYQNQAMSDESTIIPNTEITEGNKEPVKKKPNYIKLIISVVSLSLISILLVLLIFCYRKNRVTKLQTQPQGIEYETLQSHNDASNYTNTGNIYSQPLDGVENNSQYSVPYKADLNDLYAKVVPKSIRTRRDDDTSDIYAEINDKNKINNSNDVTYAELSLAKPKDIYAEVIPKNKRNNPPNKEPESNYAEFYAEAVPISECHYGNVSDNERYVNNDGRDDYAEPAYCELLVKRRMK